MTQQTLDKLAEAYRDVANAQKRAEAASRSAAQAAAKARDAILEFCVDNGITIKLVEPND